MTSGILLLHKPTGISSAKALYPVKRRFEKRKIGHTGTLDPFASGLLVVLVGQATKLSRFFLALDKRYSATIAFGVETSTLDPEGEISFTAPLPSIETVRHALSQFTGTIQQVPPDHSAVKVNGRRAYQRARRGEEVQLSPRSVDVYSLDMTPTEDSSVWEMQLHCGSGTYVRAIARDIGRSAGSAAYVTRLERTQVGPFCLSDAVGIDPVSKELDNSVHPRALLSIPEAVRRMNVLTIDTVDGETARRMRLGVPPGRTVSPVTDATEWLCVDDEGLPVALMTRSEDDGGIKYGAVFPREEVV